MEKEYRYTVIFSDEEGDQISHHCFATDKFDAKMYVRSLYPHAKEIIIHP